ncbi:hypothetical protein CRG98_000202 [Punica granatum]|uniref:Uncharacterized protein n=1 Tax=Punica granatum TaxID=22663 RepID=A0A2I0LFC3_PUNGR|nr:hypothetical protein CRG98_000202 [Punica granatum]
MTPIGDEGVDDSNRRGGRRRPQSGGGSRNRGSHPPKRENPQIGDSPDSREWSHDPNHHPSIWVVGALPFNWGRRSPLRP